MLVRHFIASGSISVMIYNNNNRRVACVGGDFVVEVHELSFGVIKNYHIVSCPTPGPPACPLQRLGVGLLRGSCNNKCNIINEGGGSQLRCKQTWSKVFKQVGEIK